MSEIGGCGYKPVKCHGEQVANTGRNILTFNFVRECCRCTGCNIVDLSHCLPAIDIGQQILGTLTGSKFRIHNAELLDIFREHSAPCPRVLGDFFTGIEGSTAVLLRDRAIPELEYILRSLR